jgi:signal peptidase I
VNAGTAARTQPRRLARSALELAAIVAFAFALALFLEAFVIKPYRIPSGSMEPTLNVNQRVIVNRIGMDFGGPHVGEIVVFHPPQGAEQGLCGLRQIATVPGGAACASSSSHEASVNFVKRVVAGPGDRLFVQAGHVYREAAGTHTFVREADSYIKACGANAECDFPDPITVPAGHWFMMGDNRGDSEDSRFWGPVPRSWIVGQVFATYWPLSRVGGL